MARSGWLAGQWQANLAACLTVASPVVLTLSTPGSGQRPDPDRHACGHEPHQTRPPAAGLMLDGGRGSRYAILSRHLVLPGQENHMRTARSPGFWSLR